MATHVNSAGVSHAKSLASAGKINRGEWSFSAEDGNALLGTNGDDWANYGKWHLAIHSDATPNTKAYYGYPYGKGGEVYRNAVLAAKGRAAQQGATDVENACSSILNIIDPPEPKSLSLPGLKDFAASCDATCPECGAKVCGMTDCPSCGMKGMTGKSNCSKCVSAQMMAAANMAGAGKGTGASMVRDAKLVNRVWSTLDIKSIDEEQRIIEGVASTPSTDLMDDVVDPMGGEYTVPMPFMMDHGANGSDDSVGHVIWAQPSAKGIPVRIQILRSPILPALDRAWEKIKLKLVNGLSIGFAPIEYEPIKGTYGYLYKKWRWLELSGVVIAANPDCSITSIKSFDLARRAASGHTPGGAVRLTPPPGASGHSVQTNKDPNMKSIAEQIAALEAKRAANAARMAEVMQKGVTEGRSTEPAEAEEFDTLQGEVKKIDGDIQRLKALEAISISGATPIQPVSGADPAAASQARAGGITVRSNLEPGQKFARYAMALIRARGNVNDALSIVQSNKAWMDTSPELLTVMKAAVATGDTTTSGWASQLVYAQNLANEFIEFLRPLTILGKLNGIRRVPFNVRMGSQTAGATGHWVGQGLPIPVSKLTTSSTSLGITKAAGLVVVDDELVRSSSPSAEILVRDDLAKTISTLLDVSFIDPNYGGQLNIQPASVTYGLTAIDPSGTNAAAISVDIAAVFASAIAANLNPAQGVWVMSATTALALSLMLTSLGQPQYPNININGGTWFGLPVIVSQSAYVAGSPQFGNMIVLIIANEILMADDGQVTIDVSNEASIEMLDSALQQTAGGTGASMVSMFQTASMAIRAIRYINWTKRRTAAVAFIEDVNYH